VDIVETLRVYAIELSPFPWKGCFRLSQRAGGNHELRDDLLEIILMNAVEQAPFPLIAFLEEFQEEEHRAYHSHPTTLGGPLKQLSDDGAIPEPRATVDEGAQAEIVQDFSRFN